MQLRTPVERENQRHPEDESTLAFTLKRWYRALFHPTIRLNTRLPWGLKEFSKLYAVAAIYYVVGSLIPIILIFGCVIAALHFAPDKLATLVATPDGHPNMHVVLTATLFSFLCGFGAELYYINNQLKLTGMSLTDAIALNLKSVHGGWRDLFRRATIGLVIILLIQNALDYAPVPKPHQSTADLASSLDTGGLIGFIFLAAVLAPLFEEIIFRGFVFNAFRNIFSEGRIFQLIGENKRVADYFAIGISSLLFAAAHMDPTAFFHLFAVGVVLAEVYRRSGSLFCPMLLHSFNNIIATALIVAPHFK